MNPSTKRLLLAAFAVVAFLIVGAVAALVWGRFFSGSGSSTGGALFSSESQSAAPSASSSGASPSSTPQPKILVIDRAAILRQSMAGKDMITQIDALTKTAQNEFKAEGEKLRSDGQALQQQLAVLAPEVRNQKTRDFNARQQTLQKKVQDRQNEIQAGVYKARKQIEDALGPILEKLMTERGANLLLDRQAVVLGTVDVDVTGAAIQRLDQKLSKAKVELTNPDTLNDAGATQGAAQPPAQ
jgi:Skp family chaperone for outer membrane proteins